MIRVRQLAHSFREGRRLVTYLPRTTGAPLGRPRRVSPLEETRLRCQAAYYNARRADPRHADYYATVYTEALQAAAACETERAMMVLRYTTMQLEIAVDRTFWPGRIFGL